MILLGIENRHMCQLTNLDITTCCYPTSFEMKIKLEALPKDNVGDEKYVSGGLLSVIILESILIVNKIKSYLVFQLGFTVLHFLRELGKKYRRIWVPI